MCIKINWSEGEAEEETRQILHAHLRMFSKKKKKKRKRIKEYAAVASRLCTFRSCTTNDQAKELSLVCVNAWHFYSCVRAFGIPLRTIRFLFCSRSLIHSAFTILRIRYDDDLRSIFNARKIHNERRCRVSDRHWRRPNAILWLSDFPV